MAEDLRVRGAGAGGRRRRVGVRPGIWWLIGLRAVLGFGIGGDYPVSATIMSEYASERHRGKMVGLVFSAQGAGLVIGPLVAIGLLSTGLNDDYGWRILLALGAVPALAVFWLRRRIKETPRFMLAQMEAWEVKQQAERSNVPTGLRGVLRERRLLVWLTLASLGSALAPSAGVMIATRALEGLAAAFVVPMTLAMLSSVFPAGPARNRAFSIWGGVSAAAGTLGLIVGGLLVTAAGWRWIFFINIPIGLLVLAATVRLLPADRGRVRSIRQFDLIGALSVTAGSSLLAYAVVQTGSHPWGSGRTIALLAGAAVLLGYFVLHERFVAVSPLDADGIVAQPLGDRREHRVRAAEQRVRRDRCRPRSPPGSAPGSSSARRWSGWP